MKMWKCNLWGLRSNLRPLLSEWALHTVETLGGQDSEDYSRAKTTLLRAFESTQGSGSGFSILGGSQAREQHTWQLNSNEHGRTGLMVSLIRRSVPRL